MNWISTKDAKPNDENDNGDFYEDVLIYFCHDCKECSHLTLYEIGMGYMNEHGIWKVTHEDKQDMFIIVSYWMPLPKRPCTLYEDIKQLNVGKLCKKLSISEEHLFEKLANK